jgi:hypothetical protein
METIVTKDERTTLVNDPTKTFTATSLSDINNLIGGGKKIDAPKNLVADSLDAQSIDLNIKVDRVDMAKKVLKSQSLKNQTNTRTTGINPLGTNTSITYSGNRSMMGRMLPLLFIVAGVALGVQYVMQNKERLFGPTRSVSATSSEAPTAAPATPVARPTKAAIFIRSVPNGAQIEIDGQDAGETPREVQAPLNKPFRIGLKRQGYIPYYKDYQIDRAGMEFAATLQKASVGYLNIEVNPSANTDIYLNGQKLVEKPPIKRYPVPAGTVIQIKAQNPFNSTQDQKTVSLKQDTEQTIRLYLRRKK